MLLKLTIGQQLRGHPRSSFLVVTKRNPNWSRKFKETGRKAHLREDQTCLEALSLELEEDLLTASSRPPSPARPARHQFSKGPDCPTISTKQRRRRKNPDLTRRTINSDDLSFQRFLEKITSIRLLMSHKSFRLDSYGVVHKWRHLILNNHWNPLNHLFLIHMEALVKFSGLIKRLEEIR